jgi:hypothetical protein
VYYIFRKLNLKAHCKKKGGRWVVDERAFKEMKRENREIQWRADERRYKRNSIRHEKMLKLADLYSTQSLYLSTLAHKMIEKERR